ncbi:hypothetical protein LDBUL1519_00015 [Lactobacillus delbrueckii subsp. bulgaricus CNCM I-1519]|nr:hypothetical protein LDBUL1519_00015 [Lactobacillus delbrueckii subsp. bulgaricus CNCM I-1519]
MIIANKVKMTNENQFTLNSELVLLAVYWLISVIALVVEVEL